jgi:hypothetical protein
MTVKNISYHDVLTAINKILMLKTKPSINKIRELIGYGSLTTISRHLKQWKDNSISKKNNKNMSTNHNIEKKTIKAKNKDINHSLVQSFIDKSDTLSKEILGGMSKEWSILLNEPDEKIKVKKLYAALLKEQMRRETAQKIAKECKDYTNLIKEQTTKRIFDLRHLLQAQLDFLGRHIEQLKTDTKKNLEYYRKQLEKSNAYLTLLKSKL